LTEKRERAKQEQSGNDPQDNRLLHREYLP